MEGAGLAWRIRFALKAQRDPGAASRFLRERGAVRRDGRVLARRGRWALEHGWRPDEISYTGTNVSDRDLAAILAPAST